MDLVLFNIIGLLFVIGIIWGIKLMSSPETAVKGNLMGSVCMLGAVILTLVANNIINIPLLWLSMLIGGLIGSFLALNVVMIQMPQMVALLNGFGGGASALVAMIILFNQFTGLGSFSKFTAGLALIIGAITFSGSMIAAAKLDQRIEQKPVILKGHTTISFLTIFILIFLLIAISFSTTNSIILISIIALFLSLSFGIFFTIRIGGADMPISISLLNSMSGLAAAIAGFAIYNSLLVAIGGIVGAAGFILTQIMCKAMNRSLIAILTGKTTQNEDEVNDNQKEKINKNKLIDKVEEEKNEKEEKEDSKNHIKKIINKAERVVIIPGYGMAVAQAQSQIKELMEKLEKEGKEVKFAIHPVAGRMPGHMNVLLAEVNISYDKLYGIDDINPEFKNTDLAIVVGANDVVNPAANTEEGTPIYGMPILNVSEAQNIFVLNLDKKPGYSGVKNPLYEKENVRMLLGDAANTVDNFIDRSGSDLVNKDNEIIKETGNSAVQIIKEAEKIIIVPGYGMALSQAQSQVKQLIDKMEEKEKEVKIAIHPVAGRMPGHMNVLLAEVDVSYDKLYEIDDINPEFKNTDLAIVVGANDVVNPAANSAEGTPIYGMPILNVQESQNIIICNLDKKPGYSGVENPLYNSKNVTLLLGDAGDTINNLLTELKHT